jgi:hypothetical protein
VLVEVDVEERGSARRPGPRAPCLIDARRARRRTMAARASSVLLRLRALSARASPALAATLMTAVASPPPPLSGPSRVTLVAPDGHARFACERAVLERASPSFPWSTQSESEDTLSVPPERAPRWEHALALLRRLEAGPSYVTLSYCSAPTF